MVCYFKEFFLGSTEEKNGLVVDNNAAGAYAYSCSLAPVVALPAKLQLVSTALWLQGLKAYSLMTFEAILRTSS